MFKENLLSEPLMFPKSLGDEMILLLLILIAWEAYWTYEACWEAARSNAKDWFIFFCESIGWASQRAYT
tara:strand:+ start:130 stop:336 length:207 start_codon:yes stop_codon:yes gene_type:complete